MNILRPDQGIGSVTPARRRATGRGRPYPPETVAGARALVEGTPLPLREIAGRVGVGRATITAWLRRGAWTRPAGAPDGPAGETVEAATASGLPRRRARRRYGPPERAAARALLEGTRHGLDRISVRLGIGSMTLFRWMRDEGWTRPAAPDGARARPDRYRTVRGRPYAADAVGTARTLVTTTALTQAEIARRVGVAQATISDWIRRRGWVRPEGGRRRLGPARRGARLRQDGDRRGLPNAADVVAAVRDLFERTELPARIIGARSGVEQDTVRNWARANGWTRPRAMPDPLGRVPRRGRVRRARGAPARSHAGHGD